MPAKRTTLPDELMAEWADERHIESVYLKSRVKVWCSNTDRGRHTYEPILGDWICGKSRQCKACGHHVRAQNIQALSQHPRYALFLRYYRGNTSPNQLKVKQKTLIACVKCGHTALRLIADWLKGHDGCRFGVGCRSKQIQHTEPTNILGFWTRNSKWEQLKTQWADIRDPNTVSSADKTVIWKCSSGHKWQTSPMNRLTTSGHCPTCTGRKKGAWANRLTDILRSEWVDLQRPEDVSIDTKVRWQCSHCSWIWTAVPHNRLSGAGCPKCSNRVSLPTLLSQEAPDLFANLPKKASTAWVVLSALGKTKGKQGAALRDIMLLEQSGYSNPLAIRKVVAELEARRAANDEDDQNEDQDIQLSPVVDIAPTTPTEPWTPERLHDAIQRIAGTDKLLSTAEQGIEDSTAYQFIVDSMVADFRDGYCDTEDRGADTSAFLSTIREQQTRESKLLRTVATAFLSEIDGATNLHVPADFRPSKQGKRLTLRMMQRLIAYQLMHRNSFGNWSAPGAGKTLAALFAARTLKSRLTVVLCPQHVIPTWCREIDSTYNHGIRVVKVTETSTWSPSEDADFLVVHYDKLQAKTAEVDIARFVENYGARVGLLVVDEVHRGKNDGSIDQGAMSARRRGIQQLRDSLPKAKLLIQTGTPMQTQCAEAASLLQLVDAEVATTYKLTKKNSFSEALRLHCAVARHGVRFRPHLQHDGKDIKLHIPHVTSEADGTFCRTETRGLALHAKPGLAPIVDLDAEALQRLVALRSKRAWSWLTVDEILTPYKLPAIVAACRPGTVVYTEHVGVGKTDPVVDVIVSAIRAAGYRTAVYDGNTEAIRAHSAIKAADDTCKCRRCVGLRQFKSGVVDVLVASRCIGEGVDGLQFVGNRLIVNSPPWHAAAWEQLLGRWYRQGQQRDVEVIVPITVMQTSQGPSSLDLVRLYRIAQRGSLADAVCDGDLPTHVGSASELTAAARQELEKLITQKEDEAGHEQRQVV